MTELLCMLRVQGFVIFWVQVGSSIPYERKLKQGVCRVLYLERHFFIRWVAKTDYWWEMEVVFDFGKIGFLSLLAGAIFWDSEMHLGSLFEAWKVESWDLSARVQLSEAVIGFVRLLSPEWSLVWKSHL